MKKIILWLAVLMIIVIFVPSCKTADFVWNPVGNWTWTIIGSWGYSIPWNETLIFTGTESGGTVVGWEYSIAGTIGTWSKTGDYNLTITFDCHYDGYRDLLEFSGSSSEASPNSMTGTGIWTYYVGGFFEDSWTMTFTGTKTTELQ